MASLGKLFNVDDYNSASKERTRVLFESYPALLKNKKILDLGAGDGQFTRYISSLAKSVVAVELNARSAKKIKFPKVRVIAEDIHDCLWQLRRQKFDTIICAGIIYHTAHPFMMLEGIANLSPEFVLIDSLDYNIGPDEFAFRNDRQFINKARNRQSRRRDCGLSLIPGRNLILFAMESLGYEVYREIDKTSIVANTGYLKAWKDSTSIWFRRKRQARRKPTKANPTP